MKLIVYTSIRDYLLVNSRGELYFRAVQRPLALSLVLGSGSMVASESKNPSRQRSYMFGIPRDVSVNLGPLLSSRGGNRTNRQLSSSECGECRKKPHDKASTTC